MFGGETMFISFEGIDGSGKSTHARLFAEFLEEKGLSYVLSREPGGTPLGETIREFALKKFPNKTATAELYLFEAARAENFEKVVKPALNAGKVVVMDRFCDSTLAYQGYANDNDLSAVKFVDDFATQNTRPELTFYLDLDPQIAQERRKERVENDIIEKRGLNYQQKVREAYLKIYEENKHRMVLIDASKSVEEVQQAIRDVFLQRYKI